jgi:hypothetical protein
MDMDSWGDNSGKDGMAGVGNELGRSPAPDLPRPYPRGQNLPVLRLKTSSLISICPKQPGAGERPSSFPTIPIDIPRLSAPHAEYPTSVVGFTAGTRQSPSATRKSHDLWDGGELDADDDDVLVPLVAQPSEHFRARTSGSH